MTEGPWEGLHASGAKRVDSKGKYDFFWVRMHDNSLALLLQLSGETTEVGPLPKLRHLGVYYRIVDGKNCYCVTLEERSQLDLFETLCRDVVEAAEQAEDLQSALARAVRRTLRWHQLLRGDVQRGLSLKQQRGLVGELAFLRNLAEKIGSLKAVEAWKGPDESAKDFELPGLFFEIKSRRSAAHAKVRISSETQLMDIEDAQLFLWVHDVDTSLDPEGLNLKDHVDMTGGLFESDMMALDIWEQRLSATGYSPELVELQRRWHLGTARAFEVAEGFPRLVPPMPLGVEDVTYAVRLDVCAEFERTANLGELILGGGANV